MTFVLIPLLPQGHRWLRVAAPEWANPLDATYAQQVGGRWNPPGSWPTLYLNRDRATARAQVHRLLHGTPIAPDDLADDAFDLISVVLPDDNVADGVTDEGLASAGLPSTYPQDARGRTISHARCQRIGQAAHDAGIPGVEARSAVPGRLTELAWWGRPARRVGRRLPFGEWRH